MRDKVVVGVGFNQLSNVLPITENYLPHKFIVLLFHGPADSLFVRALVDNQTWGAWQN